MGKGIFVCGLNGAGKTTFGKVLAQALGAVFVDSEDLYFQKKDFGFCYGKPRTRQEAEEIFRRKIEGTEYFVFAGVRADFGENILEDFQLAVLMKTPENIRLDRVRKRSFQQFGIRVLPGGDLHEQEERFFKQIRSRTEEAAERAAAAAGCPVICLDGTKPAKENAEIVLEWFRRHGIFFRRKGKQKK